MTKTLAAFAVLAVLAFAALARAATDDEAVNLQFGGDQLVGNIEFSTPSIPPFDPSHYYTSFFVSGAPNLTFDGTTVTIFQYALPPTNPQNAGHLGEAERLVAYFDRIVDGNFD
jgi:hypothetical protein